MKKAVLALAALVTLGLASCKKDYTCECEYDNIGTTETESFTYNEKTKSDAVDMCSEKEEELNGTFTDVDCNIK